MIVYYILYAIIIGVVYLIGEGIKWFLRDQPGLEDNGKDMSDTQHMPRIYFEGRNK